MDFEKTHWKGHVVLMARGPIIPGDANKFKIALSKIPMSTHGVPVVLLNSPGGSVSEALLISKHLDSYPAHMVIPNGAECASACASILYIGGAFRTMEPFAAFGQHSCSRNGKRDESCNDLISEHAFNNGVSYGSVDAFLTFVPPEDILWFSREETDCNGISRYPFSWESDFKPNMDPCFFKAVDGSYPSAQTAWRIDFFENGYKAFVRQTADHIRDAQLDVWCDNNKPGQLFLSMELPGSPDIIHDQIDSVDVIADPIVMMNTPFSVEKMYKMNAPFSLEQLRRMYSQVTVQIQKEDVLPFLTKTDGLSFKINAVESAQTFTITANLSGSRKALIFAANNCINR
jgi:hypothetical protein